MTKPIARTEAEMLRETLAQNFQFSQENRLLLETMKRLQDEIAVLKAAGNVPKPNGRPGVKL